jgi:hypothetical protein
MKKQEEVIELTEEELETVAGGRHAARQLRRPGPNRPRHPAGGHAN